MTLVNVEPSSLVAVDDQCSAVERWADQCQSIPELRDAGNKLAAIDEYLSRTSTEGRARVAAAQRRLEVRIGVLLGPASPNGKGLGSFANDPSELTKDERHAFRKMAENEDVVEATIAESTDEQPASRRKVTEAIRDNVDRRPGRWSTENAKVFLERFHNLSTVTDRIALASEFGVSVNSLSGIASTCRAVLASAPTMTKEEKQARIAELAAAGVSAKQIGAEVDLVERVVRKYANETGVEITADKVMGRTRRLDANRVIQALVDKASYDIESDSVLDAIDFADLDAEMLPRWVSSLTDSIRSLTTLKNRLKKELTQ